MRKSLFISNGYCCLFASHPCSRYVPRINYLFIVLIYVCFVSGMLRSAYDRSDHEREYFYFVHLILVHSLNIRILKIMTNEGVKRGVFSQHVSALIRLGSERESNVPISTQPGNKTNSHTSSAITLQPIDCFHSLSSVLSKSITLLRVYLLPATCLPAGRCGASTLGLRFPFFYLLTLVRNLVIITKETLQ